MRTDDDHSFFKLQDTWVSQLSDDSVRLARGLATPRGKFSLRSHTTNVYGQIQHVHVIGTRPLFPSLLRPGDKAK